MQLRLSLLIYFFYRDVFSFHRIILFQVENIWLFVLRILSMSENLFEVMRFVCRKWFWFNTIILFNILFQFLVRSFIRNEMWAHLNLNGWNSLESILFFIDFYSPLISVIVDVWVHFLSVAIKPLQEIHIKLKFTSAELINLNLLVKFEFIDSIV